MKKNVLRVMFAIFAGNAYADTQVDIRGRGAIMYDGNCGFVSTSNTQTVATKLANENSTLTCKADVSPAVDGKAVRYDPSNAAPVCIIATPAGWCVSTGLS